MAAQGFWSADLANEVPPWVRFRPLEKFAGLCVKWHTDNQNVARIIGVGRIFAWVVTGLVFLPERILILGFWLFVLISDLRGFLLLFFALAIKVLALSVHLPSW